MFDILDIAFISITVIFFAVALGYVAVCDRLMR